MSLTVSLIPLDDRPVNYDYPEILARSAGFNLLRPPRDLLGNPWRSGRRGNLAGWLEEAVPQSGALVIAIDALAYGGLVPSRTSTELLEEVLARLSILRRLKARQPDLQILAFNILQRISRADSSEEENPYWANWGRRIFRLSYLDHKSSQGDASPGEQVELTALRKEIPEVYLSHYRAIRARNHALNCAMLGWLADGILDYLLIPQDDTADYGWNIAEARRLQMAIRQRGLSDRAITYPGADEIGCLLLARLACQAAGFTPRLFLHYSSIRSPEVITSYEDRPIHELVKAHLAPLNGMLASSPQDANLELFIHAPVEKQAAGELQWLAWQGLERLKSEKPGLESYFSSLDRDENFLTTRHEMQSPQRSPEEFVRSLVEALLNGRPVALADVACVNGADIILGDMLLRYPEVAKLAGYAGWNTAGNSLGSLLAMAVIRASALLGKTTFDQERAHLEFLFLRFLEDYYYQGIERTRAMIEDLPALDFAPTLEKIPDRKVIAVTGQISQRLLEDARRLEGLFCEGSSLQTAQVSNIHLPWQRLFEIGMDVKVKLKEEG
jgi:hypothetical protein